MTEQPRLVEVIATRTLTERQQQVWEYVRRRDGVSADEVGAMLHAHRGRHSVDDRCTWCATDGRSVLTSKALQPLISYRRVPQQGRLYIPRDKADRVREPERERVSHRVDGDIFEGL